MEKIERFFSEIFRDCDWREEKVAIALGYHGTDGDQDNTSLKTVTYANSNTLLWKMKEKELPRFADCYFSVATVHHDSKSRTTDDLHSRNCLVFDFDQVESVTEIYNRFKSIGLYCHCLINSGHGFHAYVFLDKRVSGEELKNLQELNAYYIGLLGADVKANNLTQLLRIPGTLNCKESVKKSVSIVKLAENIRPYSFTKLFTDMKRRENQPADSIKRFIDFPPCIQSILDNGVEEGNRNWALRRVVGFANDYTEKSSSEILDLAHQFNRACKKPMSEGEINYHTKYVLAHEYKFFGCSNDNQGIQQLIDRYCDKVNCKCSGIISAKSAITVELPERLCNFRKGSKTAQSGEAIAIISTIMIHTKISTDALMSALSRDGKCLCGERKFKEILKSLHKSEFISKSDGCWVIGAKMHKTTDKTVLLDYAAVEHYALTEMSGKAFELYLVMKKRLKNGQNLLQENLAEDMGVTQATISKHISELERNDYMYVHKDYSVNPQRPVNIYSFRF